MYNYFKNKKYPLERISLESLIKHAMPLWMLIIFVFVFYFIGYAICLADIEWGDTRKWMFLWNISVVFLVVSMMWSSLVSIGIILNYRKQMVFWILFSIVFFMIGLMYTPFIISLMDPEGIFSNMEDEKPVVILVTLNIFSVIVMSLLVSSISLLTIDYRDSEKMIKQRTEEIYMSLYSSAALLTAGVLEVYCLSEWSTKLNSVIEHLPSKDMATEIALFFTLMLAVIYIPLFLKRNKLLDNFLLKKNFESKKEIEDWYARNLLEKRAGVDFFGISAFLLPVMTGVLVNVISSRP
uniref:Uncharacterized protein n=1 Tax=Candidatus Kentrum sp. TC TaxID=2126339 RepID=A0A450ZNM2_9GAMM|nr:MAG: hypothetical protein BECKTC1821F_GA0114240_100672 [Candidatus Kentron sp. TC]